MSSKIGFYAFCVCVCVCVCVAIILINTGLRKPAFPHQSFWKQVFRHSVLLYFLFVVLNSMPSYGLYNIFIIYLGAT